MKQLFVVTMTTEILVVAEDAAEAEKLAQREPHVDWGEPDYHVTPMTYLPADWDGDSIPFGHRDEAEPDRTVDQWMALGAAPLYRTTTTRR